MMETEELLEKPWLRGVSVDSPKPWRRKWGRWSRPLFVTVAGVLLAALVISLPGHHTFNKLQPSTGDLQNATMIKDELNDPCIKFPWLKFLELKHNNLGYKGPDGGLEGMVYKAKEMSSGRIVDVTFNAVSEYTPFASKMNGFSGKYGSINIKSGTHVDIAMSVTEPGTRTPVTLSHAALTFFDLDTCHNGHCVESVIMGRYRDAIMETNTQVVVSDLSNGRKRFSATKYGDGEDNPTNPLALTQTQKDKAVSFLFDDFSVKQFTFGAAPGSIPRFFMFIGRPSLLCAITEQDSLTSTPAPPPNLPKIPKIAPDPRTEVGVIAGPGLKFNRFKVKVGDKVQKGDTIAYVTKPSGALELLRAPKSGVVKRLQDPLKHGDIISERIVGGDTTIVVIEIPPKLPPLSVGDREVSTNVQPGGIFKEWKVKIGDKVRKGDPIAVLKHPDGFEEIVKAPSDGTVVAQQPLKPGDVLDDRMKDTNIAVIQAPEPKLPPLEVAAFEKPVTPPAEATFVEWKVSTGDKVMKGDPICVIRHPNGTLEVLRAPQDGMVKSKEPLLPGDVIDERIAEGRNVAVIKPPEKRAPLPVQPDEEGQDAPKGAIFKEWKVECGDPVKKGDPIAIVKLPNGDERVITASRAGIVKSTEPIQNGDPINDVMPDNTIAVIAPADKMRFPPLPVNSKRNDEPVDAPDEFFKPGAVFVEWLVDKGEVVNKNQPLAKVKFPDGLIKTLEAPRAGTVVQMQPFRKGDELDIKMMPNDKTIAVIRPPFTPDPLHVGDGIEPVKNPTPDATFEEWLVEPGDHVEKGDPIAKVKRPDGTIETIRAPASGIVKSKQPLQPGDSMDERVPDENFATIDTTPLPPLDIGPEDDPAKLPAPGYTFQDWRKNVGDPVKKNELIATVKDPSGNIVPILAPTDGTVKSKDPVNPGDRLIGLPKRSIAVIESDERGEVLVETPEGYTFDEWKTDIGKSVKKGDIIATLKDPHGNKIPIVAPKDGTVKAKQPLLSGDPLHGTLPDDTIAVIEIPPKNPPLPIDNGEKPVKSPSPDAIFVEWFKKPGDKVNEGDPIATVRHPSGTVERIKAPTNGIVKSRQPLKPGDNVGDRMPDENIAVIIPYPLSPLPVTGNDIPVKSPTSPGSTFNEWKVKPGDEVKKGDPIATVTHPDGTTEDIYAPNDGTVRSRQPLEPGDRLDDMLPDPDKNLAVISPDKLPPLRFDDKGEKITPVTLPADKEGLMFDEWKVDVGDTVKKSDVIAIVKKLGESNPILIKATKEGIVESRRPLKSGDKLNEVPDDTIAQLGPPQKQGATLPTKSTVFKEWKVDDGTQVKKGDPIATIEDPNTGQVTVITAPKDGTVVSRNPFKQGDPMDKSEDPEIAMIMSSVKEPVKPPEAGLTFHSWRAPVGARVRKGDPIANVEDGTGKIITIIAPKDGTVESQADLHPQDPLDTMPDASIAVIINHDKTTVVKPTKDGVFEEWLVELGDPVKKGDPIAVVKEPNGQLITITAPSDGVVTAKEPLNNGDPLDSVPDEGIATITSTAEKQAKLPNPDEDRVFKEWKKHVGDPIKAGEPIATVQDKDGTVHEVLAPKDGIVKSRQPLKPGDKIDRLEEPLEDNNVAVIGPLPQLPALPVDKLNGEADVECPLGATFKKWMVSPGDEVKAGDPVAIVTTSDNVEKVLRALIHGDVKARQPVETGDPLDYRMEAPLDENNLAVIGDRFPPLPTEPWQKGVPTKSGLNFRQYNSKPSEPVDTDIPLIVVGTRDGNVEEVSPPLNGIVACVQPLESGQNIDGVVEDQPLVVIEPTKLKPKEPLKGQVPVLTSQENNGAGNGDRGDGPGDVFVNYKVNENTMVKEGDTIADVGYYRPGTATPPDPTKSNSLNSNRQLGPTGYFIPGGLGKPPLERPIRAEKDGMIVFKQPLDKDDAINRRMEDKQIAIIDPRLLPLERGGDWEIPAFAPPDSIFKEWNVQVGDKVEKGDSLAVVLLQPEKENRRLNALGRRLEHPNFEGAEAKQILSPDDGCVMSRQPFLPFDIVAPSIMDECIAVIAPCKDGAWWLWLPLLIFLCCCCCCCGFLLFAQRKPAEPEEPPPPLTAPPGLRFDFDDTKGMCHTYYFDRHPLGIVYSQQAPIVVTDFKFNAYAKHKGVQLNWIVKRVGDTEVRDSHDLEDVKRRVKRYLKRYPVWPLRLEFKENPNAEVKTFFMRTRPIGIEFEKNKMPICIKQVYPNSNAEDAGIEVGWQITKIGEDDVEGKNYAEVMHKFRDGVDQLDRVIGGETQENNDVPLQF